MRKWGGVTAGRRPAPLLLYHSLSHVCTPPHRLVLRNRTRGWKHKTCEATESAICDISLPRVAGARAGRGAGDEVTLFRHFAAVEGEEENRKKNERRSTRTRASSPANRSGELPRESKRELPANDETGRGSPRRHRARASAAAVYREQVSPARAARAAEHEVRVDVGRVDRLHAALPHARETLPVADARRGPRRGEPSLPGD